MEGFWIHPNTLNLQYIHNNLACQENDYAFWTNPAYEELPLLAKKWYTMQVSKNEQWITRFLNNCQNIQELILFLIHTTSRGPGRSTTMVSTKLYNLDGYPQWLQIFQGDLYWVSLYKKTQSTTLFEDQSAKFIAPILHKPILQYLLIFKKMRMDSEPCKDNKWITPSSRQGNHTYSAPVLEPCIPINTDKSSTNNSYSIPTSIWVSLDGDIHSLHLPKNMSTTIKTTPIQWPTMTSSM